MRGRGGIAGYLELRSTPLHSTRVNRLHAATIVPRIHVRRNGDAGCGMQVSGLFVRGGGMGYTYGYGYTSYIPATSGHTASSPLPANTLRYGFEHAIEGGREELVWDMQHARLTSLGTLLIVHCPLPTPGLRWSRGWSGGWGSTGQSGLARRGVLSYANLSVHEGVVHPSRPDRR